MFRHFGSIRQCKSSYNKCLTVFYKAPTFIFDIVIFKLSSYSLATV